MINNKSIENFMPQEPGVNDNLTAEKINLNLKEAGMMINKTEIICEIFSDQKNWSATKQLWHEEKLGGCGTRDSNQRLFQIIRDRLQNKESILPTVKELNKVFRDCFNKRTKAQIIFLFIVETDILVKYMIHKLYEKQDKNPGNWNLSKKELLNTIIRIELSNGKRIKYAESSLKKWVSSFRGLMWEIGFLNSPNGNTGSPPVIGDKALEVIAYYSWNKMGPEWTDFPIGFYYLLQAQSNWEVLWKRIKYYDAWQEKNLQGKLNIEPKYNKIFSEEGNV